MRHFTSNHPPVKLGLACTVTKRPGLPGIKEFHRTGEHRIKANWDEMLTFPSNLEAAVSGSPPAQIQSMDPPGDSPELLEVLMNQQLIPHSPPCKALPLNVLVLTAPAIYRALTPGNVESILLYYFC